VAPVSEGTAQQVGERINQRLGDRPPAGGIYHAEGPTDDGGWWTFNVWESAAAFQDFDRENLQPVLQEVGAPRAQVRQLRVQWDNSQMQGGS
jgi:hypothetical protein